MPSIFGFVLFLAIIGGSIAVVFKYRNQIKALFDTVDSLSVLIIRVVGIIAICFGSLDIVGTLSGLAHRDVYASSYGMRQYSGNTYGSVSTPNDVETNKSRYMYEFANVTGEFGRAQLWQRLQLDIIIICFGAFLVAYGSRRTALNSKIEE